MWQMMGLRLEGLLPAAALHLLLTVVATKTRSAFNAFMFLTSPNIL